MQACTNIDIGVIAAESIRTTVAGGFVRSRRDSANNADPDGAVTSAVASRIVTRSKEMHAAGRAAAGRQPARSAFPDRSARAWRALLRTGSRNGLTPPSLLLRRFAAQHAHPAYARAIVNSGVAKLNTA